jgi:DNA-binding GntR family transcriptional regulator
LREALNRLIADGLVERREQRGFIVAGISADDLAEITKTRCWLEEIALRESIAAHSTAWEEALVLAHHRLARTPRSLSDSRFEDNPDWEPLHRAFHRALIAGCGSRWLLGFCEQLADQHHRYRRLSAPRAFAKRGVKSEHQQLMEAAIEGRADEAVALLRAHFERTAKIIRDDPGLFAERVA